MQGDWLKACVESKPEGNWVKPCHKLGFCPYGQLVEEFPLKQNPNPEISCEVFGHNCPVFHCAENLTEDKEVPA